MSEINLNSNLSSCMITGVGNAGKAGSSDRDLVNELVMLEWQAFDKVQNEGGRASCQDDWDTFSIMRRAQYDTWTDEMLKSFTDDFYNANEQGWNLIPRNTPEWKNQQHLPSMPRSGIHCRL